MPFTITYLQEGDIMSEPREPRPGHTNPERGSNESQSERRIDFSRLTEDTSVTGAPDKFFTHPDYPNTLFRREYYGDSNEAHASVHFSGEILKDYEKRGIDMVPHVPVGVDTSTGDTHYYTAVEKVEGARSLGEVVASGNVSDSLATKIDQAGKAMAEQLTEAVRNSGEVNPELASLRQLAVAPASPDKPNEQRLVYIDVEAMNPETVPKNEGTWTAGHDSVMQAAIVLAALPVQGMPEAVQQTREEIGVALERADTETFASMAMDNEETDSSKGQAWRDHIESGDMKRVYSADFSSAQAHALFKATGERVFGELTPEQEGKVREYEEQQRTIADREKDSREGREKDGPDDGGSSRGDDEGEGGLSTGPEGGPDPNLPPAPAVLPAEQEKVLEQETRERGEEQVTSEEEAQERTYGESDPADFSDNQTNAAQPGVSDEEARQHEKEREVAEAHQRALELADAAARGEKLVERDGLGKDKEARGVEQDAQGKNETPVAELNVEEVAKQAEVRELTEAARKEASKEGLVRGPELTLGEALALQAERDALTPVQEKKSERKGVFGKIFKSKEKESREQAPELLPNITKMTPAERAAHDEKVRKINYLREQGLDPGKARQLADGISAGGEAARTFELSVDSQVARLRAERGLDADGKEVSKELGQEIRAQAERQVLGEAAEGVKAIKRRDEERELAKVREDRERYDRENPNHAMTREQLEGIVNAGRISREEHAERVETRAQEIVRIQGLEKEPDALARAREQAEKEMPWGQSRGRGANDTLGQSREQGPRARGDE